MNPGEIPAPRTDHPAVRPRSDRGDGRLLRGAVAAAVLIHLAFVFLPLPSRTLDLPTEPKPTPIEVTPYHIQPPPVPVRPPADVRPAVRRIPLPAPETEPERLEPVPEPIPVDLPPEVVPADARPLLSDPVGPPPRPAIVPEGTPGLVAPVKEAGAERPDYPALAARAGLEGRVVLSAVIAEDGRVREIAVLSAPRPDVGFAAAAIAAVRTWRYRPGRLDNRTVAVQLTVVVDFRMH